MNQPKYEIIALFRDRWVQVLSVLLIILCVFAAYNGQNKVEKRMADIADAFQEMQEGDEMAVAFIDSVEAGFAVTATSWTRPDKATAIGNYHPRVAAMPPSRMAILATGQSDLYTHYVKPTISGDEIALNFTELTSPVQLLFGSFDLAFVLIYLLPLIVIAFSYNMLSAEREMGSLKLLASQPISLITWLVQKAGLRLVILGLLTLISLFISLLLAGTDLMVIMSSIGQLTLLVIGYLVFWFTLSILINLGGKSSAHNAVSLLGLWVLFVLLIPSLVNQLATTIYPVPSRAQMINDMRVIQADASKRQDEILDSYLRDHPELMLSQDGDQNLTYNWWSKHFASKDLVKNEMAPMLNDFESQVRSQQGWVRGWRFISPAMIMQGSLNALAGTSTDHYEAYRIQVIQFSEEWRDFLMPLIFHNRKVTTEIVGSLPRFTFDESVVSTIYGMDLAGMWIISLITGAFIFIQYGRRRLTVT